MRDGSPGQARTRLVAGIDEAGYGPLVGPLCVGFAALRIPADDGDLAGCAIPDIWRTLEEVVSRDPCPNGRIAVNDSKRLKLANGSQRAHPLCHLERGVLAALANAGGKHECDHDVFASLGADISEAVWMRADPTPLPLAATRDFQRLAAIRLAAGMERASSSIADLRCIAICERKFNDRLAGLASKARVSFEAVAALLRRVWGSRAAADASRGGPAPMVVIDRQGGRTDYACELGAALGPEATIDEHARGADRSEYTATCPAGRRLRIIVMVEAEGHAFPVALASMIAKYVRELAMLQFNAYWNSRFSEVRPTAGYGHDGRRWLKEVLPRLTADEVAGTHRRR